MSAPTLGLSLSVGDKVVYPNQGMCLVTDIKTEEIAGQKLTFVSLVFQETGAKVKVPQDKLAKNGVRRVSGSTDADEVFDYMRSDSAAPSLKWKMRALENTELMGKGTLLDLAKVVKNHYDTAGLRPLPPKEREQYNDSRDLLVAELSVALGVTEVDAEDAIDAILFPVGTERPRRSLEEFGLAAVDDDADLGLGLDDDLGAGDEGEEKSEPEEAESEEADGDEEKPAVEAKKKPAKTAKASKPPPDSEITMAATGALTEILAPKKRGRPPKAKTAESAMGAEPKKRGRPPKAKAAEGDAAAEPKKRGRPPKQK